MTGDTYINHKFVPMAQDETVTCLHCVYPRYKHYGTEPNTTLTVAQKPTVLVDSASAFDWVTIYDN